MKRDTTARRGALPTPSNLTRPGEFNKYTTTSRVEKWLVRRFLSSLSSALPSSHDVYRVLEIGVGEGHVSERVAAAYPEAHIVGLDLPHEGLADRWTRHGVNGVFGDAHALPFLERTFDLVLAIEVLEHLPEPERALEEIARVTSGTAILSVPLEPLWRAGNMARGRYWRELGNTPDHIQHWTPRGFRRLVDRHMHVEALHTPLPWTLVAARRNAP